MSKGRGNLYLMTRDGEPFCGKFYILNNLIFFLHFFFHFLGTQYMVSLHFSGRRGQPIQSYGRIQLMLVDKNGINETFSLTQ